MSDTIDDYRAIKERSQQKRAESRERGAEMLTELGIEFLSKNFGAHLIITGLACRVDYWPGTGKWIAINGEKGRGMVSLRKFIDKKGRA